MSYDFNTTVPTRKINYNILAGYWFAYHFFWTAVIALILQDRMVELLHAQGLSASLVDKIKDQQIGYLLALGAVFSTFVQLTIGYISDFTVSRFGRRKPYIFFGVLLAIGAIWLLFGATSIVMLYIAYFAIQLTINIASVPYQAMLPDLVDPADHGKASAAMGIADFSGKLFGLMLMILVGLLKIPVAIVPLSYTIFFLLGAMLILVYIKVEPSEPVITEEGTRLLPFALPFTRIEVPKSWAGPFDSTFRSLIDIVTKPQLRNFMWVALSRIIIHMGYYAFIPFFKYYIEIAARIDSVPKFAIINPTPENGNTSPVINGTISGALVFIAIIVGGLIGTIFIGKKSDKENKRNLIWISSGIAAGFLLLLLFSVDFYIILMAGFGLGIGWGGFVTTDWAWACNLMPRSRTGSFMGVWDITTLFPQVVASSLAGNLILYLKDGVFASLYSWAYRTDFFICVLLILTGALLLLFINEKN